MMKPEGKRPKLIGLVRLSTVEQKKEGKAGLLRQYTAIEEIKRIYGADIIRTAEVIDVSGRYVRDDPQFQQIFMDLKRSDIDGVACVAVDRILRPEDYTSFGILDNWAANGKMIYTPSDRINPQADGGWIQLLVQSGIAGMELRKLHERCAMAKDDLRREGRHAASLELIPYGVVYDKATAKWDYHPLESQVVLVAFDLLYSGYSYRAIAEKCGGVFGYGYVPRLLSNKIWIGIRHYMWRSSGPMRISKTGHRYRQAERSSAAYDVRVIPEEKALVSREYWEGAQRIMEERHHEWGMGRRQPRFELAGFLRCTCGQPWYSATSGPNDYYVCRSMARKIKPCGALRVRAKKMEAGVDELMGRVLPESALVDELIERLTAESAVPDPVRLAHEQELTKIEARRSRLMKQHQWGDLTDEEYRRNMDQVRLERQSLMAMIPAPVPQVEKPEETVRWVINALACYATRKFEAKRAMLADAVDHIRIKDGAIDGVVIKGRFIGGFAAGVKVLASSGTREHFGLELPDLSINLPNPIQISSLQ